MHVLILGANGLLGHALRQVYAQQEHTVYAWDQRELDITDAVAVSEQLTRVKPELIINAAAYNAVDAAEAEPDAGQLAFQINATAVRTVARAARKIGATFVHYSTDYVFDGMKRTPYAEADMPNPLSVYGASKRAGEEYVLQENEAGLRGYIIRTSRLFGGSGEASAGKETFSNLVLRLCARERRLEFIDGVEIASPTLASDLAGATQALVTAKSTAGVYHRTNSGEASWYQFAAEVISASKLYTLDSADSTRTYIELVPVRELATRPAPRPQYSVLTSTKLPPLRPWQEALREYMARQERAIIQNI